MNSVNGVKVWDPLVRIFHWSLVVAFFTAYFTEDELQDVHVIAGYTVLGLVLLRIVWGFVGTRHARFADFVYPPRKALEHLKLELARKAPRYLGHNPAGGVMIIALLVCLLITTVSGVALYGADQGAGPLAALFADAGEAWEGPLEEVHEIFANLTLVLVALHIAGVLAGSLVHKENLVRAMITGRKRA